MRLDRISDTIFVAMSARYAQVTSTIILTDKGAVVVDTLPFPSETREILSFVEAKMGARGMRYVIHTHHHADHVNGTSLFASAEVISHELCRELLGRYGQRRLEEARRNVPELSEVRLRLPDMALQGELRLNMGDENLYLFHSPGHTADGISVYVASEKVLIAGDAMMPVPHIVGGNIGQLTASLKRFKEIAPNFIVQGHGNVLLRGEAGEMIDASINYLSTIVQRVDEAVARGLPPASLRDIDIESCGLSRIPLDGLVSRLHLDNLVALYKARASR
ncbi:MAG: MBL fold metallo-hydrolase [Chloroflexi bacterium]|nr:MBL fold metallo-hydrolase [Chloroflexota bacterium]